MANRFRSHYPDIGVLGEDLVAEWLQSTNWIILHRRWRCRWGEIDLIAQAQTTGKGLELPKDRGAGENPTYHSRFATHATPVLAFVEVKTRSRGSWDAGGLLAITAQKQAKLWQTAQCFLATYPDLIDCACRFDVALVRCQQLSSSKHKSEQTLITQDSTNSPSLPVHLGQVHTLSGYQLSLQEYIPSAFD